MALAAEPNVIFPAETSPGKATSSRLAFEQAISDVMARVVGRFLVDVETLGLAELDRHTASLTAAGGPSVLDKSALLGDARDQGASVFVIRSLWERITDTAIQGSIDAMLSALPLPLRWRVFERMVRERFLSTIDEPDVFDLAYTIIDTAVRDVTENGVSRRVAERTMKEELSYLKPTGEATEFAWRAERLARTASTTLYNDAMIDQLAEDGFTHKLWVTYHDDKVRETHQQADGMSIPIEQPFIVGGSAMMQPGDTSAPIGEWINCRCVIVGENGPTTPGIDWSIPVMTESERIEAGFPADISLAASGRAFATMNAITRTLRGNPRQARAPKGTRIGGRWIETPTGLLHTAHGYQDTLEGMEEANRDFGEGPGYGRTMSDNIIYEEGSHPQYKEAMGHSGPVPTDEMAQATRQAIQDSIDQGVAIGLSVNDLNKMADAVQSPDDIVPIMNIHDEYKAFQDGTVLSDDVNPLNDSEPYMDARSAYESVVVGGEPVYGMGVFNPEAAAEQGRDFGPLTIVLNDDVMNRTGWVAGDGMEGHARPIMTDEVVGADAQDLIAASSWIASDPNFDPANWEKSFDRMPYVEAQVMGGLTLDDVKEIHIPTGFENNVTSAAYEMLRERNIPIRSDMGPTSVTSFVEENWAAPWLAKANNREDINFADYVDPSRMHRYETGIMSDYVSSDSGSREHDDGYGMQAYLNDKFAGETFGKKNYTVVWQDASSDYDSTGVRGTVLNEAGHSIGDIERTYSPSESGQGQWQVSHDMLKLRGPGTTGTGFGTDFTRFSEEMYRELGVDKIDVHAALEDGGQTWAKAGFQFKPGTSVGFRAERIQSGIDYAKSQGDDDTAEKLSDWLRDYGDTGRVSVPVDTIDTDFGTAQDVAKIIGNDPDGDSILKGSDWYGEKFGDSFWGMEGDDSIVASAARHREWDTSKVRSDLYFEFCTTHEVDYTGADPWPDAMEALWVLIEEQERDRFESSWPTLTASASAPTQVRAPKGTPIGGEWIDTPGAMLNRALATDAGATVGNPEVDALGAYLTEQFEGRTYGDGFTVKVSTPQHVVKGGGRYDYLDVGMTILDKTGAWAGDVERQFMKGGEKVVHGSMNVHEAHRGKGFSTDFSKHSEEVYRGMGIKDIGLLAVQDGGRVWAKAGYQWDEDGTFQANYSNYTAVVDWLTQSGDTNTLSILDDMFQGNDPRDTYAVENNDLIRNGITPQDILNLTDSKGNPIGRDIMQDSSWQGIKHLFPVGDDLGLAASGMLDDDWNASRERSDLLYEFCTVNGLDYDAIWDDAREDEWTILDAGALTASVGPTQARAPKGASNGGQWIDTPSGLMERAKASTPGAPTSFDDGIAGHTNALLNPFDPNDHEDIRQRLNAFDKFESEWKHPGMTNEDSRLAAVYEFMGTRDAAPTLVDELTGSSAPLYRGVAPLYGERDAKQAQAQDWRDQWRGEGEHYAGRGVFGNGTYFWENDPDSTARYSIVHEDGLSHMIGAEWKDGARIYDNGWGSPEENKALLGAMADIDKSRGTGKWSSATGDIGTVLAILGYDGMRVANAGGNGQIDVSYNREAMNALREDFTHKARSRFDVPS